MWPFWPPSYIHFRWKHMTSWLEQFKFREAREMSCAHKRHKLWLWNRASMRPKEILFWYSSLLFTSTPYLNATISDFFCIHLTLSHAWHAWPMSSKNEIVDQDKRDHQLDLVLMMTKEHAKFKPHLPPPKICLLSGNTALSQEKHNFSSQFLCIAGWWTTTEIVLSQSVQLKVYSWNFCQFLRAHCAFRWYLLFAQRNDFLRHVVAIGVEDI